LKAQLYGDLAAIMASAEGEPRLKNGVPGPTGPGTLFSLVAGARNHRQFTISVAI
jgi:hypothetical protein